MHKEPKILLIEDNEGDVELITEAFKEYKINLDINVVSNGEEAIKYLSSKAKHTTEHRPDLILLDINLPKVDGKEVLHFIKTDNILKTIPVIMLTSSSLQNDIYYFLETRVFEKHILKPSY